MNRDDLLSLSPNLESRISSKFRFSPDGCMEFTGSKDSYGYGKIKVAGRNLGAHRVSMALAVGYVSDDMVCMHHCDNRACINPAHMSIADQKRNVRDCIDKGRFSWPKRRAKRIIIARNDCEMLVFSDVYAAMAAGFKSGPVSMACRGLKKRYRGYAWSYESRANGEVEAPEKRGDQTI